MLSHTKDLILTERINTCVYNLISKVCNETIFEFNATCT